MSSRIINLLIISKLRVWVAVYSGNFRVPNFHSRTAAGDPPTAARSLIFGRVKRLAPAGQIALDLTQPAQFGFEMRNHQLDHPDCLVTLMTDLVEDCAKSGALTA